jgi:hypothetical protein
MAPAELRFNKGKTWIYLSGMALAELRFNKAKTETIDPSLGNGTS